MTPAGPPPDQVERDRALDITHSALAIAPAGSGKTSLLVARALKCLAVSSEPEEVVALTFTNKAAAEIRTRLIEALQSAQAPAPGEPYARTLHELARKALAHSESRGWSLLQNPNRLRAMTIDALNAELAGRLPLLSGLGGPPAITDDNQGLFVEAIQSLFAELEDADLPAPDRLALGELLRWGDNRLDRLQEPLATLLEKREQWRREVRPDSSPEQDAGVLEGLLHSRLKRLDELLDPDFKQSLLDVLSEGSAHAEPLAWAAKLHPWPDLSSSEIEIWQKIVSVLITGNGTLRKPRGINKTQGFLPGQTYTRRMKALLERLQDAPGGARIALACHAVALCPQASYPEHLRQQRDALARALLRLIAHLRVIFSRRGKADFTEVALAALDALSGEAGYSEVLDRADARIRHLLVDEMQDTSESQVELLEQLTSGWIPGDGHSLFIVGDPKQSIYAFRKAEVRLFLSLWDQQMLGCVPLERIELSTNFRSQPALIDWFNASFTAIFPEQSDVYASAVNYRPCAAPAGANTSSDPAVRVQAFAEDDGHAEAAAVSRRAAGLLQQGETDIAILARSRSHLWRCLAELRRLGIPYSCQDIDPLQDLPAVREYLHLVRALWHPEDRLAWAVLLRSPLVGLSYADLLALSHGTPKLNWPEKIRRDKTRLSDEGRERLAQLMQVITQAEADPLLYGDLPARAAAIWHALGGPACVSRHELQDVRIAMRYVREAAADGDILSLTELKRSLGQIYATPSSGQIQVLTAHKSKGLEFDHVLLVGCGKTTRGDSRPALHYHRTPEGVLLVPEPPDRLPGDDPAHRLYDFVHELQRQAQRNERVRLLYVCCTRARRSLSLFVNIGFNAKQEPHAKTGSFAELLWPVIQADCTGLTPAAPNNVEPSLPVPRAPRLPLDYRFVCDDNAYRPRERRSLRPSEAALEAQESKTHDGDLYARLVGTMYHEAMRRIARDGMARWQDAGKSRRSAMAAGFRHLGLPEPQVETAVGHVLRLLKTTLESKRGQWLLQPRAWAQSEYALAGYRDGQWVSAIVDRCFEENGTVWVIDYKTTTEPASQAAERHRGQLRHYADLLAAVRQRPVRTALFLAEAGELLEVELGK